MKVDPRAIAEIKARLNIVDVVRRYVELRNVGGRYVGSCPFHQETKGSFNVRPDQGLYHCFGCQASGDVISFYGRINGLDFRQSLEQLAQEAGVVLRDGPPDASESRLARARKACQSMHELAQSYFTAMLKSKQGAVAREYLEKRGVSPELCERFGLGYSGEDWQGLENHLKAKGYNSKQGVYAGLLSGNDAGRTWDRFRGRLIFPIKDVSGKVIAFGGRIIGEGDPKYLNSADSPIYKKGEHLYGLHEARPGITKTRRAMLGEGYLDVITLHQFGYVSACGVLGTALTPAQVRRLAGFCKAVDLVFDGDAAGRKAALKSAQMFLAAGLSCRVVLMPEGEDVDSLLRANGPEALDKCLGEAREGLDYCLSTVRREFSPKDMTQWAKDFLKEFSDEVLLSRYMSELAARLGFSEEVLRNAPLNRRAQPSQAGEAEIGAKETFDLPSSDSYLLEFALRHPHFGPELVKLGLAQALCSQAGRDLWRILEETGGEPEAALAPGQMAFYSRCKMADPLSEAEQARQWDEICLFLGKARSKRRKRELLEAMRLARDMGDEARVNVLLQDYNNIVGEV